MSIYIQVVNSKGPSQAATITFGTAQKLFPTGGFSQRLGIEIRNTSSLASIYVQTTAVGGAQPTITNSTAHVKIPPDTTVTLGYGTGLDVWVDATANCDFVASEVLS